MALLSLMREGSEDIGWSFVLCRLAVCNIRPVRSWRLLDRGDRREGTSSPSYTISHTLS